MNKSTKHIKSKMNVLATIYLTLFILILLFQQFSNFPVRIIQIAMLILGAACIKFYKKNIPNRLALTFYIVYTMGGLFSWLFNGNADLQEYLWVISFGGIAILLLNQKIIFNIISPLYYFSMGFMCLLILSNHGVETLHMLSSRNVISSLGILLFSIYAISAYQSNSRISFIAIITYAVTAFLGIGRSGVLLAIMLLGTGLIWNINENTFQFRNPVCIIAIVLILGVGCLLLYNEVIYPAIYNIAWRGVISHSRVNIWIHYFAKVFTRLDYIIFGAPVSGNIWLDTYAQNLHNSLLNLHSKYGFGIVLLVLFFTVNAFIYLIRKKALILLIPFAGILFRAQIDYTNFNGTADIIWYYFMFLPFFERHKSNNEKAKNYENYKIQRRAWKSTVPVCIYTLSSRKLYGKRHFR